MTEAKQSSREDVEAEEPATDNLDGGDEDDSSSHREHLDGVEDGCGCTEIWEHLSENRDDAAADD
jgi:hypothetical protein